MIHVDCQTFPKYKGIIYVLNRHFFLKLTIKTPEQCKKSVQSALERLNDVILVPLLSIFNFELISHIVLCLQYSL